MTMITCSRCNGLGKHSFNTVDGDVCYGCWGKGKVPDKKTAAAERKAAFTALVAAIIAAITGNPDAISVTVADKSDVIDVINGPAEKRMIAALAKQGIMITGKDITHGYQRLTIRIPKPPEPVVIHGYYSRLSSIYR